MMLYKMMLLFLWAVFVPLAASAASECEPNEFVCANGECVHMAWRCDGSGDCDDESDERNCPSTTCTGTSFQCDDSQCITASWVCDGHDDCKDGSDEKAEKCTSETNTTSGSDNGCPGTSFKCDDGQCITESWVCDEHADCKDSSDEKQSLCNSTFCEGFKCQDSGRCIPDDWKCDGTDDCEDGSDEKVCDSKPECGAEEFQCANDECISSKWRCDQREDCNDGSDEKDCDLRQCKDGQFTCHDGSCINEMWKCDGDADCEDGSDETANCSTIDRGTCESKDFRCLTPLIEPECIHLSWKCDGDADCGDGSDEENCPDRTCGPDEVMCKDEKYCIKKLLLCDQQFDCHDKSDELDCPNPVTTCEDDKFDCFQNGTKCIAMSKLCDGRPDCENHADEALELDCPAENENPCSTNKGGCQQECIVNATHPQGRVCDCKEGYEMVEGSETQCKDIDECAYAGSCSQDCVNTIGSFKCQCQSGYALQHGRFCKATVGHPAELFLSDMTELRRYRLDSYRYTLLVDSEDYPSGAKAMDYDIREKKVYWTGAGATNSKTVFSSKIESGEVKEIMSDPEGHPTGIAVDWIHHNLYITDSGHDAIIVATTDGKHRRTLVSGDMDEPRALVLDPYEGWMYWTDWGFNPKIEKCGMNGKERQVIRDKHIVWPNGLTLDYISNRLYWVDAKLHTISSSNLMGKDHRVIHKSHEYLGHPYSITVFEDYLYWSDWMDNAVHKVNKFGNGEVQTVAPDLKTPYEIRVYHIYRQPQATNYCEKNKCSHFCLPTPRDDTEIEQRTECACPNGMDLKDLNTCVQSSGPRCGADQFDCFTNGTVCISKSKICDKTNDCPNSKDEAASLCSPPATQTPPDTKITSSSDATKSVATTTTTTSPDDTKSTTTVAPTTTTEGSHVNGTQMGHGGEEKGMGKVAMIVIPVTIALGILVGVVVFLLMRRYRKKNKNSMNFDNPVYRKTTTDEQLIMEKESNNRESMQPLNDEPEIV